MKTGQWYGVGHMLLLLNETVQREDIIIIKRVKDSSFEWCIVCLSKMSLDKSSR